MEQDTGQDPDPSRPESQGSHRKNLESHVMVTGGLDLDPGWQVSIKEGSEFVHSLEEGADTTKAVVNREKRPPTYAKSSNSETQISTRSKTIFSSAELSMRVSLIADVP